MTGAGITWEAVGGAFHPWGDWSQTAGQLNFAFFACMVFMTVAACYRLILAWRRGRALRRLARDGSKILGERAHLDGEADARLVTRVSAAPAWLRELWAEFREQVWTDDEGHPRNFEQGDAHFGADAIDPGASWAYALPGLLTALGILGTLPGVNYSSPRRQLFLPTGL